MKRLIVLSLLGLPLPSVAQQQPFVVDNSIIGNIISAGIVEQSIRDATDGGALGGSASAADASVATLAQAGEHRRYDYRSSPVVSTQVRREFLARVAKNDATFSRLVASQFERHDPVKVYANIVAPFGLRQGDVADSMTGYMLLAWMIANAGSEPSRERVAAVRALVAGELAANPAINAPANRQRMDEELMMLFVIMHAGWQSAQREGRLQAYSDGVNAMFAKQFGRNLRKLVLTDTGFVERG